MISRDDVLRIGAAKGSNLISIYLPTTKEGSGESVKHDQLMFKNQVSAVTEYLSKKGIAPGEINEMIAPLANRLNDQEFWKNQSQGLAIFLGDDFYEEYRLSISFEPAFYVSTGFLVWPLVRLLQDNGKFYLLALSKDNIQLYRSDQYGIEKRKVKELDELRMEDVVGVDFRQKNLQLRSQQGRQSQAIYHSHGEGREDQEAEMMAYFRVASKIIDENMPDRNIPLVLAGLDHHVSLFRKVYSPSNLLEEYLSVNPASKELSWLQTQAWSYVKKIYEKKRVTSLAKFNQVMNTSKTEMEIERILPAAFSGKIDTLFIRKGLEIWGIYIPSKNKVRIDDHQTSSNVSLINLLALNVMEKGGDVFILEDSELPDEFLDIYALFRYE